MRIPVLWLAILLSCATARAQTPDDALPPIGDIDQALRGGDWPTAAQLAAAYPDPVAAKLVIYYRLTHIGGGNAAEIAAFMAQNPEWPGQALLLRRRDEALAGIADNVTALPICTALPPPQSGPALARCAEADAAAGQPDRAAAAARAAWVAGFADAASEARFLQRWRPVLTPTDQLQRFRALIAAGALQAAAQVALLSAPDQRVARARLAIHAGSDPGAILAGVPPALRADPDLVLDAVRALRRGTADGAALALWTRSGFAAEQAAGAPVAFWAERSQLARGLLQLGDDRGAYLLADDALQTDAEASADAAFLAGFIALQRLHQPAIAAAHFRTLAASRSVISQARAQYWLARAAAAAGDSAGAAEAYAAAAALPTTYYGQLAAIAAGSDPAALVARIGALRDPTWSDTQAQDFAGRELQRAATLLVAWGDPPRARAFLQQIAALAPDAATSALDAHLALGLELPDQAVATARRAGRDGTMLPQAGWPLAADPPTDANAAPPAVTLGIIRQESSFDTGAISPAGARGLMQLMPPTAAEVARQIGLNVTISALNTDPAANMRLGAAYLGQLITRYDGALPLAIAAYNAGPSRVDQWLGQTGDPRLAGSMIDWIELIPFAETRNYVERVVENIAIYRALRHEPLPYPVST